MTTNSYPQNFLNIPNPSIKTEPRDTSPQPKLFGGSLVQSPINQQAYRVPLASPSPQPNSPVTPTTAYGGYASPPYHTFQNNEQQPNFEMPRTHNLPLLPNYNYTDLQFQNPAGLDGSNLTPLLPSVGVLNNQYNQYNAPLTTFDYKPNMTGVVGGTGVVPSNVFHPNNFSTVSGNDVHGVNMPQTNPNETTNMSTNSFDISNALDMYSVSSTEIRQQIQELVGETDQPMNTEARDCSNEDEQNISDCLSRLTTNTINEIANIRNNK